jgi:pimeloyl-ACP methyl ester carboxylesterase
MTSKIVVAGIALNFLAASAACHNASIRAENHVDPAPIAITQTPAPIPTNAAPTPVVTDYPATIEHAAVEKDSPVWFVRGKADGAARIVFMPGLCSNAAAYLTAFPQAANAHGGVVAIDGDKPCGAANSGFHSFTWDAKLQKSRIDRALAALEDSAPPDGFTLVGYSAGASIAELVHEKWPALFPRLVLIAPPEDLWIEKLVDAQGVVSMSCSLDVPGRMKSGAKKLGARGVRATYMEMPKCTHGNITDGERIFGDAFSWLDNDEKAEAGE